MSGFALFTCCEKAEKKNILLTISDELKSIFKKPILEEVLKKIDISEEFSIYVINLPYSIDKLNARTGKIINLVDDFLRVKEGMNCILPDRISDVTQIDGCLKNRFKGKLLFRCIFTNILDKIYTVRGIRIGDLDVAIVKGDSCRMLYSVINQLAPSVKYLTVITDNKEVIDEEINNICYDTGLSISIVTDYKIGLRNTDFIINLGTLNDSVLHSRVNTKAAILNYGEVSTERSFVDSVVINGIDVGLPDTLAPKLHKTVYSFYSKLEIAELVICHKLNCEESISDQFPDYDLIKRISEEFKRSGYGINKFLGRRNAVRVEEIIGRNASKLL